LTDENGNGAQLKEGAHVNVTVEAHKGNNSEERLTSPPARRDPFEGNTSILQKGDDLSFNTHLGLCASRANRTKSVKRNPTAGGLGLDVLDSLASQPLVHQERQFDQATLTFYATTMNRFVCEFRPVLDLEFTSDVQTGADADRQWYGEELHE
jgi:hypothetical protein